MYKALEPTCSGPYVDGIPEAMQRARELSREELRKLLDETNEDANLDTPSNGDVSDTGDLA